VTFEFSSAGDSYTHSHTHTHRFGPIHVTMGLTSDPNFQNLEKWYKSNAANLNMRQMFEADKNRFQKFRYFTLFIY